MIQTEAFDDQDVPLADRRCIPCEGDVEPLSRAQAEELLKKLDSEWTLVDGGGLLARSFTFPNFKKTMEFVNKVADIAEEEGHHPDLTVSYGNVGVELMTHAIGGLSENDFILASKIDKL